MREIKTLVFNRKDADKVGGVDRLREKYEAQGFRLVEIDPETLKMLYSDPDDGEVVLIMDKEIPVPIETARPTAVWPRGRRPANNWDTPIHEEVLPMDSQNGSSGLTGDITSIPAGDVSTIHGEAISASDSRI